MQRQRRTSWIGFAITLGACGLLGAIMFDMRTGGWLRTAEGWLIMLLLIAFLAVIACWAQRTSTRR